MFTSYGYGCGNLRAKAFSATHTNNTIGRTFSNGKSSRNIPRALFFQGKFSHDFTDLNIRAFRRRGRDNTDFSLSRMF